jgi:hypothetical protein
MLSRVSSGHILFVGKRYIWTCRKIEIKGDKDSRLGKPCKVVKVLRPLRCWIRMCMLSAVEPTSAESARGSLSSANGSSSNLSVSPIEVSIDDRLESVGMIPTT